jgi:hypothetical protein
MAEKIRVIKPDAPELVVEQIVNDKVLLKSDSFLFDIDKFYRDYRKEIAPLASCGTVIFPLEYFKKWAEKNKE